jgi:hypothetical protein
MAAADESAPPVRLARDRELASLGWLRRFTASPPRLVELRTLYEELGQDVLLDRLLPGELASECEGCTLALTVFRVIYTRPPGATPYPSAGTDRFDARGGAT